MAEHFDIAVVGTGSGGYVAALKAGQLGAKVAVVEKEPFFGGTCLNYGCIPSKALLASAELLHAIARAGELGVTVAGEVGFSWPDIQKRKDKVVKTLRGGIEALFGGRKVKSFHGLAALDGPGRIVVTKDGAAGEALTADNIILAVGSVPSRIGGWPDDETLVCTSDEALHWDALPASLLIVGGGVIGCEFACMMQAFGVDVTVVEMMPRLLPEMDEGLGEAIENIFTARGITCLTDTKVEELIAAPPGAKAALGGGRSIEVERVLVATGRRPNTEDIGLGTVGLETDRGFVPVNDRMETAAAAVYCVGDANGRCLLAHAASAQGVVAVANALGGARTMAAPVPATVYTFPEVAAVGVTQQSARAAGTPISVGLFPLRHLGKAMAVNDTDGFVKVIRHRETDELLGVHMLGHNVTECIAAAGAMLGQKVCVRDLAETVFAHPTISEALKESAEDALGMALHLPPRKIHRVVAGE